LLSPSEEGEDRDDDSSTSNGKGSCGGKKYRLKHKNQKGRVLGVNNNSGFFNVTIVAAGGERKNPGGRIKQKAISVRYQYTILMILSRKGRRKEEVP